MCPVGGFAYLPVVKQVFPAGDSDPACQAVSPDTSCTCALQNQQKVTLYQTYTQVHMYLQKRAFDDSVLQASLVTVCNEDDWQTRLINAFGKSV